MRKGVLFFAGLLAMLGPVRPVTAQLDKELALGVILSAAKDLLPPAVTLAPRRPGSGPVLTADH